MKTVTWYYLKEKSLAENCSRGDDQSLMRSLEWLDSLKECTEHEEGKPRAKPWATDLMLRKMRITQRKR